MTTLLGYASQSTSHSSASVYDSFIGGSLVPYRTGEFPPQNLLRCHSCRGRMCFVLQLYCPISDTAHHRSVYLFACLRDGCQADGFNWIALRSQAENIVVQQPTLSNSSEWSLGDEDTDDEVIEVPVPSSAPSVIPSGRPQPEVSYPGPFSLSFVEVYEGQDPFDTSDSTQPGSDQNYSTFTSWVKIYEIEQEFIDEDDNTAPQSFTGIMQTYMSSRQDQGCESIRYCWAGIPVFNGPPPPQLESLLECPRCRSPRVFEFQLFPALNNYLKLDPSRLNANEDSLPYDLIDEEEVDLDWLMKFNTVLVFSCASGCWTDSDEWVQECVVIQTDGDRTCITDADAEILCQ